MGGWIEAYDKKKRPGMNELAAWLSRDVMALFSEFSNHLARNYGLSCAPAVYTAMHGWIFKFGRSGLFLFDCVTIEGDAFRVEDVLVNSRSSLQAALSLADQRFAEGFADRYREHAARIGTRQAENTKKRLERERKELEELATRIQKERFNRYRWSPKVSRKKLRRLYESDAAMIGDEELADDIGHTLYARCLQGRDERALIFSGRIRCHGCGNVLTYQHGLIECACGAQYLFHDYMRSFRTNNMPANSAAHIFNAFIEAWPRAKTYADKMRIIDGLVHEFHINLVTGVKGRFVGINLIEGTKKQIEELILSLANGGETGDSLDYFKSNLRNK